MLFRSGRTISAELEDVILACLEKNRAKRPQTARDLAQMLARCPDARGWNADDADAWWSRHERGLPANQVNAASIGQSLVGTRTPQPNAALPNSVELPPDNTGFAQTMISGEID